MSTAWVSRKRFLLEIIFYTEISSVDLDIYYCS